ncbi:cation-translocating P-type ATPase [Nocardioides iriomotensis]|uniref:Cation-transporting P-type ATPase n=1 Tax=Nocardioides iriomotensis TaxID=715784 RepID=A0A4Q5J2C8_9ACTN|nr:cation-transporting P-type ATPase [Nocardioides iriomotensis]RYU11515.1 cation-transporting P-type ATPase [Nocardioides iriomotensis]
MPEPTTVPAAAEASPVPAGLSSAEARRRLAAGGPNLVPRVDAVPAWRALLKQFTHLLAVLLVVAALLALLAGMPALTLAIAVVVVLNAAFAFWQEYRADRSAERLRELLPSGTRVRRDGTALVVPAADVVTGDVLLLEEGDRVCADAVVRRTDALTVDESLVTGESVAVPHEAGEDLLAGTFVVQGAAEAEVTATGTATTLARISELAASAHRPSSPLSVALRRVVRFVALTAVGTGVLLGAGALLLGLDATAAFLFGVGVAVALVPEGLLPTVTLSLAHGAQQMAGRHALVRRLDAVETLGATTYVCTDKTGTITQNRMAVVSVWQPSGWVRVEGEGYTPEARVSGDPDALGRLPAVARWAAACVHGRARLHADRWVADGDPMDAAVHALLLRLGGDEPPRVLAGAPFSRDRMLTSVVVEDALVVLGAPEQVLARCVGRPEAASGPLSEMTGRGLRVLAVARRTWPGGSLTPAAETGLDLVALLGLEDPPRPDVGVALARCRAAGIRVAMLTGDHPRTAEAIAREVGLLQPGGLVVDGRGLPEDDASLGSLLDSADGAVVARVTPADKLRIARALRGRGHVVAMTGDGVNDVPALREADVGVAMGASGSDVAREAADLVLLDDHFATIVHAVELGRATFANVRRFLTYHLTDNVAELAPFVVWAMTAGQVPLAITVLQVLALDIGTDMLPALALGTEPPGRRVMQGPLTSRSVVDRSLLWRSFGVLGPVEAVASLGVFVPVLLTGGWTWGTIPSPALLGVASGSTFAAIALAQMANAFACRSDTLPPWRLRVTGNPAVLWAVGAEAVLLVTFLGVPALADVLGGTWPLTLGWAGAAATALALLVADATHKRLRHRRTVEASAGVSDRPGPRRSRGPGRATT